MLMQAGWFALGAVLLLLGADSLLRGAAGMALALRVRPFLVGLVVLGLGTSLPELAVNLAAMRAGHAGIALGNAVGSSIANFGLVLGVAALVAPFAVGLRLGVVLLPLVVACTVILGLLGGDSVLTRFDAAVLLALGGVALVLVLARAGRESADVQGVFAAAAAADPEPDWRCSASPWAWPCWDSAACTRCTPPPSSLASGAGRICGSA